MIILQGKYNEATVYTSSIEQESISQIIELCNQEIYKGCKIRVMPDVHAGMGCTIGLTMVIDGAVTPNLVGVDGGCGVEAVKLNTKNISLDRLDSFIHENIPSGFNVRGDYHPLVGREDFLMGLRCYDYISLERAKLSIGTLGGGNHFIELNEGSDGSLYLCVHSGSRYLGKQVCDYYQKIAWESLKKGDTQEIIKRLKALGRENEIEEELKKISKPKVKKDLAYLTGDNYQNYLNDMVQVKEYAVLNREVILQEILKGMGIKRVDTISSTHNFIEKSDGDKPIIRKGAISAYKHQKVIIPINMRDGSIIGIGKGNLDWNYSAPHGAGRIMSRSKAKENIPLKEYEKSMEGIYSTSVGQSTLDEAPQAYKPIEEIVENIKDTVDIVDIIKPVYNFKSK